MSPEQAETLIREMWDALADAPRDADYETAYQQCLEAERRTREQIDVVIDRAAWGLMQSERAEMENQIARLTAQRDKLLEACRMAESYYARLPKAPDRGHDIAAELASLRDAISYSENSGSPSNSSPSR